MMEGSIRFGFMTVFAVSGSVVLLVNQVHKHMLKNFMKKFECEICGVDCPLEQKSLDGSKKHQIKKKVRFADDVLEIPIESNEKVLAVDEGVQKWSCGHEFDQDIMPPNRAVLYREIMKYRALNLC